MPPAFPDDPGADTFVRDFPTAVAPVDRRYLMTKPPLFVLQVPGDGPVYDNRVREVVEALREPVDERGKLIPYAVLDVETSGPLLAEQAGDRFGFGLPRRMTPDRLPQFTLLRGVVEDIRRRAAENIPVADADARSLRDSAYARRAHQGGLPGFLWAISGGDAPAVIGTWYSWLLSLVWLPLTRALPRWWWARRKTHQLIRPVRLPGRRGRRGWLGAQENIDDNVFRVLDNVSRLQANRLAQGAGAPYEAAMSALEQLLLRALLEDLSDPPPGRWLPRRRRRTARPLLLVPLPRGPEQRPPAEVGRAVDEVLRAERFLAAFCETQESTRAPGPLVIAIGQPSDALLDRIGPTRNATLLPAGHLLQDPMNDRPVLVRLSDESFGRPGLPIRRVQPKTFRVGWRTANAVISGAVALVVLLAGIVVLGLGEPYGCVGGSDPVAVAAPSEPVATDPTGWYDAAMEEIGRQNERAEAFVGRDRTVRTVVAFVSNRPTSPVDTLFDGTIPELRGIALWQRKLNQDATADLSQVPLIVDVRETGTAFERAEEEARKLVEQVRAWTPRPDHSDDHRQVIGVLGYAQSRNETKAALQVLDEADILTIGTTATADEMLGESTYWPVTPLNSREAAIAGDFAASHRIVARQGDSDGCVPAGQALVIENYGDLYSRSIAGQFVSRFQGQTREINFTQDDTDATNPPPGTPTYTSATDLADLVCDEISKRPDTVVYWSSRAQDFTAFVASFDTQGTCTDYGVTVLGGNELTNVAQTGVFNNKQWLRLYYSAHRLPADDARASSVTRNFISDYNAFVTSTTEGEDPWINDGHSAVAYDAFHVLSRVAAIAYGGNPPERPNMEGIFKAADVTFNGATGFIRYATGVNQPPVDKTLTLLYQTGRDQEAVVVCGAYQSGQSSASQDKPCPDAPS